MEYFTRIQYRGMKALYLKEDDVEKLVSIPEVIEVLDTAFRDQAAGRAWTNSRSRLRLPGATLHMMAGAIPGYFGYKAYTVGGGKANSQREFFPIRIRAKRRSSAPDGKPRHSLSQWMPFGV